MDSHRLMELAITKALEGIAQGQTPFGCAIELDGQVIGAGQGAVAVLGGGGELAVSVHDGGQHGQRLAGRGGRGGRAGSSGLVLVVAGQFRGGAGSARLGDWVNT